MKNSYQISVTTALLSLVFFTGIGSTALGQDSADTTDEPRPTPTIPGNRDSAIQETTQSDQNDNCLERESSVAGTRTDGGAGPVSAPGAVGTDARIDASRVNCLDEHNDAPHEDNLRLGNPNTPAPSERTDLIIDEEQRNSSTDD